MITGLLLSQRSSFPAWLPYIHSRATFAQSSERRVRRWLGSPATNPVSVYGPLITRALRDWGGHTLILALDTSVLFLRRTGPKPLWGLARFQEFCLIRVSVLFRVPHPYQIELDFGCSRRTAVVQGG